MLEIFLLVVLGFFILICSFVGMGLAVDEWKQPNTTIKDCLVAFACGFFAPMAVIYVFFVKKDK